MKPVISTNPAGILSPSTEPSNPQYLKVLYPNAAFTEISAFFNPFISLALNDAIKPLPYNGSLRIICKEPETVATPISTFLSSSLVNVNPSYFHL